VNAAPIINPKLISLVRAAGRWLIDASRSLSPRNKR
jgi:hypothetical protein